jgi:hypothetical protein
VQGQPDRPCAAIEPPGQFCRQATGSRLPWNRPWPWPDGAVFMPSERLRAWGGAKFHKPQEISRLCLGTQRKAGCGQPQKGRVRGAGTFRARTAGTDFA